MAHSPKIKNQSCGCKLFLSWSELTEMETPNLDKLEGKIKFKFSSLDMLRFLDLLMCTMQNPQKCPPCRDSLFIPDKTSVYFWSGCTMYTSKILFMCLISHIENYRQKTFFLVHLFTWNNPSVLIIEPHSGGVFVCRCYCLCFLDTATVWLSF